MSMISTPSVRSLRLLESIITPKEFEEYRGKHRITVETKEGVYLINSARIRFKQPRRCWTILCVVFTKRCTRHDSVIMRYLLVKNDEPKLWATAQYGLEWGASHPSFVTYPQW